jgi:diguanylate cyclase (GGDEF)-like protein/PAS domain S-box-containing protein
LALGVAAILAGAAFGYQRGRSRIVMSERRLRTFLQTTRDGVVVFDDRGIVHEFNPATRAMFGYAPDDIVGSSIAGLMPDATVAAQGAGDADRLWDPNAAGVPGMDGTRQVVGLRRDGSRFPAEVTFSAAFGGGRRIHVGIIRDITERKELERRLLDLATTDGLTGVLNRRAVLEAAENAFQLARRYGHALSVLMIDADHFKRVNDSFGHPVGDTVLVRLAMLARDSLRTTDRFGRFGGEEFLALLPDTDAHHAQETAERLLAAVRAAEIDNGQGGILKLTVSIGVASLAPGTPDAATLIMLADAALYRAKQGGRDQWRGEGPERVA